MSEEVGAAALLLAVVASGLVAGLFFAYSVSVMGGLGRAGDSTFVEAMQQINVAILNGWFALVFLGAPLSTALALVLHLGDAESLAPTLALALALSVLTLVITFAVNVPLNNDLAAAAGGDPTAARMRFESRWVRWNQARTVTSTAAFGCLAVGLLLDP